MNAYQLADELNKFDKNSIVANTLRQQADRIAELEKQLTFQPNQTLACPSHLSGLTPQIKPLSDEEIWALSEEFIREKQNILLFARAIEERHGIK